MQDAPTPLMGCEWGSDGEDGKWAYISNPETCREGLGVSS